MITAKKTQASRVSPIRIKEVSLNIGTTRKMVVKTAVPTAYRITAGQVRLIPPYSLSVNLLSALFFSITQSILP
jgi:hypothetical protein